MSRSITLAALAAALSITSAGPLEAQSADSTRAPRPRHQVGDSVGGAERDVHGPRMRGMREGRGTRNMRGTRRDQAMAGREGRGGMRRGLMRDITLSDAQQRALRSVQVKRMTEMKPLQLELMSARMDARIARLNGDQKALDAANARLASTRERVQKLAADREPMSELRAVLTPEQQKLLDRNLAESAQRRPGSMRGAPGMQGMRGMREDGGARGERGRGFAPGRRPNTRPGTGAGAGAGAGTGSAL